MKLATILVCIGLLSTTGAFAQNIPIPANYSIIDTVSGDLDKDGIRELVVACNTKTAIDPTESVPRELIIYKQQKGQWILWKKSGQALYASRDGGMMGDPFGEIEIKNGLLLVSHEGGSSWKWGRTDKYRYQAGELQLIGFSSNDGKLCNYWVNVDFNLSTGKLIVKKEYEDCENSDQEIYKRENETIIRKGIRITFEKRMENEIKIVTPKYKHEIYLTTID